MTHLTAVATLPCKMLVFLQTIAAAYSRGNIDQAGIKHTNWY